MGRCRYELINTYLKIPFYDPDEELSCSVQWPLKVDDAMELTLNRVSTAHTTQTNVQHSQGVGLCASASTPSIMTLGRLIEAGDSGKISLPLPPCNSPPPHSSAFAAATKSVSALQVFSCLRSVLQAVGSCPRHGTGSGGNSITMGVLCVLFYLCSCKHTYG